MLANTIAPDGRTQTQVTTSGNITDITTSTLVGAQALNSFEHFSVDSGHIVNLHVPSAASNLINLVHASQSRIDGVLNSIQNGQIGGNVYFLNPHGVVVGSEGVINVGSLSLITPTVAFMDRFFLPAGDPDPAALSAVLGGAVPIGATGLVVVEGRINAARDIQIASGRLENTGEIVSGAVFAGGVGFGDLVNVEGLEVGGALAERNGRIVVETAGDLVNRGTIRSDGADGVDAGEIEITSGGDITLATGSVISARGIGAGSSGGRVVVFAGGEATLEPGALIHVGGGDVSGDGGFVELSAAHRVTLSGAIRASAAHGRAGSILIDPEEILVDADQLTDGADYTLSADKSITVKAGVTISTRNLTDVNTGDHVTAPSEGDSGSITLTAPTITIGRGARLLAHAVNAGGTAYAAGDITLTADSQYNSLVEEAAAATRIEIDGALLKAGNITLDATSEATYVWEGGDLALKEVATLGPALLGVQVGVAWVSGRAEIVIKDGSALEASGAVDLSATTTVAAGTMSLAANLARPNPLSVSFIHGNLVAEANVEVQDGAAVTAQTLNIAAKNTATLDLNVYSITPPDFVPNAIADAAVAVADANVTSKAVIGNAAIDVAEALSISAFNENSFAVNATAMAMSGSAAGVAASIFTAETRAEASNAANLTGVGSLTIEALDRTTQNKVTASTAVGQSFVINTLLSIGEAGGSFVAEKLGISLPELDTRGAPAEKPKVGSAVTIVDTEHAAVGFIAGGTQVAADGDVVVVAKVEDKRLQNHAMSSVESNTKGSPTDPTATIAVSAAVAYGDYEHNAEAYIGDGAEVTAQRVGVASDVIVPYEVLYHKWEGPSTITSKINGYLGLQNGFLTGFANATEGTSELGFAGSVLYLDFENNSTAYLGRNAAVTILPGAPPEAVTNLPSEETREWRTPMTVTANAQIGGAFVAGNISLAFAGAAGDPGAASAGAAYGQVNYGTTTRAFIAEGASVKQSAGGDPVAVSVIATTTTQGVAVGPTAGRGASIGFAGVVQIVNIDDETSASVDDEAEVEASKLDVTAEEDIISWVGSGAFNMADSVGVGISVAINDATTRTSAFIGDNDGFLEGGSLVNSSAGRVTANEIDVSARTDGHVGTLSVGLAVEYASDPAGGPGLLDKAKAGLVRALDKLNLQLIEYGPPTQPPDPKFGIGISGSSSVSLVDLDTDAYVRGATLVLGGPDRNLAIQAVNDTNVTGVSGSAALAIAKNPSAGFSVGIAGSVAVNLLDNDTAAYVDDSEVTGARRAAVQALAGGEQIAVAIGLAVNASADQAKAAAAAGSVSVSEATNTVTAYAKGSTLSGAVGEAGRDFSVVAYDRTLLGTGGGSLFGGGRGGFGGSVTYSEINNTVSASLDETSVTEFDAVRVHALTSARLVAAGAVIGFAGQANSVTLGGTVVFSEIDNTTTAEVGAGSSVTATDVVNVTARDIDATDASVAPLNDAIDVEDGEPVELALDYTGEGIGVAKESGSSILSVAGVLQGGRNNAGISFVWNSIGNTFRARISDAEVAAGNAVNVHAESGAAIGGLAVGVGLSTGSFAGGGSVVVNEIENEVIAEAVSSSGKALSTVNLGVTAKDRSWIGSLAGQVTMSTGNAAIGGTAAHNEIGNTVRARLSGIDIDVSGSTKVQAANDANIQTLSVSGGGSQSFAFNGSAASSHIANTTEAEILESKSARQENAVEISATDTSLIQALSGGAAFSGTAAVGAAVSVNRIANTTAARLRGSAAGSSYNVRSLTVTSDSQATVESIAVGVGGDVNVGVAGSIATNFIESETTSSIDSGAKVIARNNVGVLAETDDAVKTAAGSLGVGISAAGVGASAAASRIGGSTRAFISDSCLLDACQSSGTEVSALALDPNDTLEVNATSLNRDVDLAAGLDLARYNRIDLSSLRQKETVRGLAVNASATHSIESIVANAAGGQFAGVAGTVNVKLIDGSTEAYIEGALINPASAGAGGAQQSVSVMASDHAYGNDFVGTLAAGPLGAGVGIGVGASVFDRTTRAYIDGSEELRGARGIEIQAHSSQGTSSLAVGGTGGIAGVSGTGAVAKFTSTTEAYLKNATAVAGDVAVNASHRSRFFVAAGGGAVGAAAVGGTFAVALDESTTRAYVEGADLTGVSGDVFVDAEGTSETEAWGVSGALGAAAVVGSAVVSIVSNTTEAFVKDSQVGTVGSRANNVRVKAIDKVQVTSKAGAVGVDLSGLGGGIGLSASVTLVRNTTSAYVQNSRLYAAGTATISAESERDLGAMAGSLGVGGLGFSGAAGVILAGRKLEGEAASRLYDNPETPGSNDGILSFVEDFATGDRFSAEGDEANIRTGSGITEEELALLNSSARAGFTGSLTAEHLQHKTSAYVDGASTVRADGDVYVSSWERVGAEIDTGGGGVAGLSFGASVGYLNLTHNVESRVLGGANVVSDHGLIDIAAVTRPLDSTEPAASVRSYQGNGGIVGVSAAVAVANVTSSVIAAADRTAVLSALDSGKSVAIRASDALSADAAAYGITAGVAAAGAIVARAYKDGVTSASFGDRSAGGPQGIILLPIQGRLRIDSERRGGVNAAAFAGAGGVLSGAGADAQAEDKGTVTALLGDRVLVTGGDAATEVRASAQPKVSAKAQGFNAGAVTVGVSIARATATPTVSAIVGDGGGAAGNQVTVAATVDLDGGEPTAKSEATASIGALIGGAGAQSEAKSTSTVQAYLGAGLVVSGDVSVRALNRTDQRATASGRLFGVAAGGAAIGSAHADSETTAVVGDTASGRIGGRLTVLASGEDRTEVSGELGSGGGIAIAGLVGMTNNVSVTRAELGSASEADDCESPVPAGCLVAHAIDVDAVHTARFNGELDSIRASAFGGSGSTAEHEVDAEVEAVIRAGARLRAQNLELTALNIVRKDWLSDDAFNVTSGSGGLIDVPAAKSESTITTRTNVIVGEGAEVFVVGDRDNPGVTSLEAANRIEAFDKVKLDAGGAIPIAKALSKVDVNAGAAVRLESGAALDSVGVVTLAAGTDATVETHAGAKTYGLASAAEGESNASIETVNNVTIAGGAGIRADGDVNLVAGGYVNGGINQLKAVARTDLFNKTAVPIETDPIADASITQTNTVAINAGALVRSRRDIALVASDGSATADGQGIGKDLYRELAEEVANAFSNLVGAGDVSLEIKTGSSKTSATSGVTVDGTVHAGIYNKQRLVLGLSGDSLSVEEQTDGVLFSLSTEDLVTSMFDRLERLISLRAHYANDPVASAAYDAEINFLRNQLVRLGYAEVAPNGDIYPSRNLRVTFINVEDVSARGGDIYVLGGYLAGSGSLKAPNDTEITILNHTPYFLRTSKLTIEDIGGHLYFNGVAVGTAQEIQDRNRSGAPQVNLQVEALGSSDVRPEITVQNTFNPITGEAIPPDIELTGDVTNRTGTVSIVNNRGSIKLLSVDENQAAPNIIAHTVQILAPNGNIEQEYVDGLQSIGGDPASLWADVAASAEQGQDPVERFDERRGSGSWIAGNNVFLSARYLNINGTVQSGIPDWSVTLGADLQTKINEFRQNWIAAGRPNISGPADLAPYQLTGFVDPDPRNRAAEGEIAAFYNPQTDQIVLEAVAVRGGYLELYGEILNTGGGHIKVLDGYGRITVQNFTGRDIVVSGLDTGNNIAGVVRITDTAKRVNGVPVTAVYERIDGRVRTQYWAGDQLLETQFSLGNTRESVYRPVEGIRYVWTRGQDFTERYEGIATREEWFDFIPGSKDHYDSWTLIRQGDPEDLPGGAYTKIGGNAIYEYSFSEYNTSELVKVGETQRWNVCNSFNIFGWCVGSRTYYVKDTYEQGLKHIFTHSVRADFPIDITFIGYDPGDVNAAISVSSDGDILLAGPVSNTGGGVFLSTTGQLLQTSERGLVTGRNVNLQGRSGVGTELMPVAVRVLPEFGGALFASSIAGGDVFLESPVGGVLVEGIITLGGNVRLEADSDILGRASSSVIAGKRIDLVSRSGQIGDASRPLNLQAGDGLLEGVSAVAARDIVLRQLDGDFRLIEVRSLGGDVVLEAMNGSLVDGNPNAERDERTIAELERLWDEMLLTGAGAQESAENTLRAYQEQKKSEYLLYWSLRGVHPSGFDEHGNPTGYEANPYNPAAITDPDLRREFERLHEAYGSTEYDPNWTYVLSDEERAALTQGAEWTDNELRFGVPGGILFKQTTSTETRIEAPNVVGRNVTLIAHRGSIGTDNGEIVIDGTNPDALKDDDARIALAAAEVDDVAVDNETRQITVLLRDSIDVAATGEIVAEGRDHIYLGSRQPIYVKTIHTGGSIRVKGTEGVYSVSAVGPANIQGGRTILEGGDGGIGTDTAPLRVDLEPGASITARAARNIYIEGVAGDLNVAEIFSESDVFLTSYGSILDARGERPLALQGKSVYLLANYGSIGTRDNPLVFAVGSDGTVTALVSTPDQGVFLRGVGGTVNAATLVSGGALTLEAVGGSIVLHGPAISSGDARFVASGDFAMNEGAVVNSTGGSVTVGAAGSASLRRIASEADVEVAVGGDLTLYNLVAARNAVTMASGGDVMMEEGSSVEAQAGDVDLTAEGDAELRQLTAGNNVTANVGSDLTLYEAVAAGNGVTMASGGNLLMAEGSSIQAQGADVELTAMGAAELRQLTAANDVKVNVGSDLALYEAVAAGNAVTMASGGNLLMAEGSSIEAQAADIDLTAAGAAELRQLTAGNDVKVNVGRELGLYEAVAAGNAVAMGSGDSLALYRSVLAGNGVALTSGGDLTMLEGSSIEAQGTDVELTAEGVAQLRQLTAGNDVKVTVASDLALYEAVTAGNAVTMAVGSSLTVYESVLAGNGVALMSGGNLLMAEGSSIEAQGADVELTSEGVAQLRQLAAANDVKVTVASDLALYEAIAAANAVTMATGGNLLMAEGSSIEAQGADVELTAEGVAQLRQLTAANDVKVTVASDLTLYEAVAAGNAVTMASGGNLRMSKGGSIEATAGPVRLTAQEDVRIHRIATAGDIDVDAGGSILGNAGPGLIHLDGNNVTLQAARGTIGLLTTPIVVLARGIVNASAFGGIYIEKLGGDLDSEYMLSETGSIHLWVTEGDVRIEQIAAPSVISIASPGDMSFGTIGKVSDLDLNLLSPGRELHIGHATVWNSAKVRADLIRIDELVHDGTQVLRLDVSGVSGLADSVTINASSDRGIVFDRLLADYAVINGVVDNLAFLETVIGSIAEINNRYHTVRVDNVNKALFDVHLQLYAPDLRPFYLIMAANRLILTNAYDVNYDSEYIETIFSTENSFVRMTRKMMELVRMSTILAEGGSAFVNPFAGLLPDGGFVDLGEETVNTDDQTSEENGNSTEAEG